MYVLIKNGAVQKYQYSVGELRKDNPGTSFPKYPTDSLLAEWGVYPVVFQPQPFYDPRVSYIKEGLPVQNLTDKQWYQTWSIEALTTEQINKHTQSQADAVRADRNNRLSESDWIVSFSYEKQQPVPTEWIEYRQALRDISRQELFPWDIQWPDRPTVNTSASVL